MRTLLPVRRPLDEGIVEHGGEVVLARDAPPSQDPGLVLRAANAAARSGLPISNSTLHRLADYSPEIRGTWPSSTLESLLDLLAAGPAMLAPVEALDRMGLWGRLFPEWDFVRDLPAARRRPRMDRRPPPAGGRRPCRTADDPRLATRLAATGRARPRHR